MRNPLSVPLIAWLSRLSYPRIFMVTAVLFGVNLLIPDPIILIDEVMTPDSSRFWAADSYAPGRSQPSFDKQPLRDYLDAERRAGRWNGEAPPPKLPAEVVAATSARYLDAYRRLTGSELAIS